MSVSMTYPGIYIQELPGPPETITPAPTSVTVFIGYTHPYKTQSFSQATQIGSFSDYQQLFGGLYADQWLPSDVAYAVQQFFLNGGSTAYVVGIPSSNAFFSGWTTPKLPPTVSAGQIPALGTPPSGGPSGVLNIPSGSPIVTFSGLEPIDANHTMTVVVSNFTSSPPPPSATPVGPPAPAPLDMADVTISYGSKSETFRRVSLSRSYPLGSTTPNPNFIETRINGNSRLVWVSPPAGAASYGVFAPAVVPPALPPTPQTVTIVNTLTPPTSLSNPAVDFLNPNNGPFVENGTLDQVPIFNLMLLPGVADAGVWGQAISFCERKRAFLIFDPPASAGFELTTPAQDQISTIVQSGALPTSINAALYFPYLTSIDPLTGSSISLPPSGTVAGIFATTDNKRGVWKAPAGIATIVNNITGVVPNGVLTDFQQGILNPLGVNCLRTFPGTGTVVFGARTTTTQDSALQQWRYVPVRRMALFIEQTLYANLGWVIFEPNDTPLWNAITTSINAFMLTLFHQGAFQGATASDAFQVKCDATTTTQADINNGIVNILVAFAPLKPAEFVVIKIAQLAGQAQT